MRPEDIVAQAGGADVMFHCANVPYHEMVNKLIPLGESVMEAAERLAIKVVAIDGIYPYGRRQTELITEEHPKQPHTIKGKIRLDYERMLFSKRWSHAQVMIVRLPDYYGPTANEASYLGSTLEAIAAGKMAFSSATCKFPANMSIYRTRQRWLLNWQARISLMDRIGTYQAVVLFQGERLCGLPNRQEASLNRLFR